MPMTDYVNQILAYVKESQNYKRGIELIEWYSDLIHHPLKLEMFKGENPLFPNFKVQVEESRIFFNGGIRVYKFENNICVNYVFRENQSHNIETLCNFDLDFNIDSEFCETDLFN